MQSTFEPEPHPWMYRVALRCIQLFSIYALYVAWGSFWPAYNAWSLYLNNLALGFQSTGPATARCSIPCFLAIALIAVPQWVLGIENVRARLKKFPEKPWLARIQWANQHMVASNKIGVRVVSSMGLFALLVAAPIAVSFHTTLAYVLVGCLSLLWLLIAKSVWGWRFWGRAELKIATLPGLVGGPFSGAFILHESFSRGTLFQIVLRCDRTVVVKRKRTTDQTNESVWSDTLVIERALQGPIPGTTAVPFSFSIPYECPQTEWNGDRKVNWYLAAKVQGGSVGDQVEFVVPIFRTSDSQRDFRPDPGLMEEFLFTPSARERLQRYHLQERLKPDGGVVIELSHWDPQIFVALLVLSLLCAIPIAWIICWNNSLEKILLYSLVPGLLMAAGLYGLYDIATWRSRFETTPTPPSPSEDRIRSATSIHEQSLRFLSGPLGFRRVGEIASTRNCILQLEQTVHSSGDERWDLILHLGCENKKIAVLLMMKSRSEAKAIQQHIAEVLKVGTSNAIHRKTIRST